MQCKPLICGPEQLLPCGWQAAGLLLLYTHACTHTHAHTHTHTCVYTHAYTKVLSCGRPAASGVPSPYQCDPNTAAVAPGATAKLRGLSSRDARESGGINRWGEIKGDKGSGERVQCGGYTNKWGEKEQKTWRKDSSNTDSRVGEAGKDSKWEEEDEIEWRKSGAAHRELQLENLNI